MKNYFSALMGYMLALAITTTLFAQKKEVNFLQNDYTLLISSLIPGGNISPSEGVASVNLKALKIFSRMYKKISNASWDNTTEGFRATFTLDNVKNSIYFDRKGNWLANLITYPESKFAKNERDIIKREYYDYNIYQVQEVTTLQSRGLPTFVIYLENKTDFKTILMYDGDMQVWQDFKKQ